MQRVHTILHPTDFSECSDAAFELARQLATAYGARLVVLHVTSGESLCTGDASVEPRASSVAEELQRLLSQLRERAGGLTVETRLAYGNPVERIDQAVKDVPCDLVVMGTHGRSGWGRLLMGSVAEGVVRLAGVPVTTVHLPHHDGRGGQVTTGSDASTIPGKRPREG